MGRGRGVLKIPEQHMQVSVNNKLHHTPSMQDPLSNFPVGKCVSQCAVSDMSFVSSLISMCSLGKHVFFRTTIV